MNKFICAAVAVALCGASQSSFAAGSKLAQVHLLKDFGELKLSGDHMLLKDLEKIAKKGLADLKGLEKLGKH